jgi:hypothetical protein
MNNNYEAFSLLGVEENQKDKNRMMLYFPIALNSKEEF